MDAVRPKTGKKESFEDGKPTFYPRSFFSCCFFISLAAYAGFQELQAVLFSSYLVHKMTSVVSGVPSGDRGKRFAKKA